MPDNFKFDFACFELPVDDEYVEAEPSHCDWCGDARGSDYFVVARGKHHSLCPLCWGRSAAYRALQQKGMAHENALRQLGVGPLV